MRSKGNHETTNPNPDKPVGLQSGKDAFEVGIYGLHPLLDQAFIGGSKPQRLSMLVW